MINLRDTVNNFSKPIKLLRTTIRMDKGREIEETKEVEIYGMIKPLNAETIAMNKLNIALAYLHYVGDYEIDISDYVLYKDKKFKCFSTSDYSDFGFFKADFEEIIQ